MLRFGSRLCCRLAIVAAVLAAPVGAQGPSYGGDDKAAALAANILLVALKREYVTVPKRRGRTSIDIVLIGKNRFGRALQQLASKVRRTDRSKMSIRVISIGADDITQRTPDVCCADIVVLATNDAMVHNRTIKLCSSRPVMLVSCRSRFISAGGHLELYVGKNGRMAYEIDHVGLVRDRGFGVSATLVKQSKAAEKWRKIR